MEGDDRYYIRRASEERTLASGAAHPQVRHAHLSMAERYEQLAKATAEPIEPQPLKRQLSR